MASGIVPIKQVNEIKKMNFYLSLIYEYNERSEKFCLNKNSLEIHLCHFLGCRLRLSCSSCYFVLATSYSPNSFVW